MHGQQVQRANSIFTVYVSFSSSLTKNMNEREGEELRNAGYMYSPMTTRSMIRVRTGVIDMGRKSGCVLGAAVLLIGRIEACFHCRGTKDVVRDRLNKSASGLENNEAPSLRNQAGSCSRPVDVGRRVLRILNTCH